MTAPDALYLEQWPEEADRNDRIFYEPTGYGEDGKGNTSTITVYVKESLASQPTPQTARVAFKGWTLEAQWQFLRDLRAEHAYCAGAADAPFPFPEGPTELRIQFEHGRTYYLKRKSQIDAGERGEILLAESSTKVTWDFVDDDLGLDEDQLAERKAIRERLCAAPVVEVAAYEGEESGVDGHPYWYAIYLRDREAEIESNIDRELDVGTIECASGRPSEQAIIAALTRWHSGPEYRVTKKVE